MYDLCILYECCREFTTGQDPEQAGGFSGEIVFKRSIARQTKLREDSKKASDTKDVKDVHYSFAVCYSYIYTQEIFTGSNFTEGQSSKVS